MKVLNIVDKYVEAMASSFAKDDKEQQRTIDTGNLGKWQLQLMK